MRENRLGERGPVVSSVGLGTMSLLTSNDEQGAGRMVARALDAGVTLIDTADVYGNGAVEEALGRILSPHRDRLTLATKVGLPMEGDVRRSGGSARWITRAVDDSLRRLRADHIDLYQLHRPDLATPLEETLAAFDSLVQAGKIRWAGSSVMPAEMIVEGLWIAERNRLVPLVSEQAPYSMLVRGIERAVLPAARRFGVGVIAWSPLNGGWLTGKYRRGVAAPEGSRAASGNPFVRADDDRKLAATERLSAVADAAGLSLMALALGWAQAHPAVSSVLVGPRSLEQLEDLLRASEAVPDAATLDAVDAVIAPGVTLDPSNDGWAPPGLAASARRQASTSEGVEGE